MRRYILSLVVIGSMLLANTVHASGSAAMLESPDTSVTVLHAGVVPEDVCRRGESGVFFVFLKVDTSGQPADLRVVGTDNEGLADGALETGKTFLFQPKVEDRRRREDSLFLILEISHTWDSALARGQCTLEYSLAPGIKGLDELDPPEILTRFTPRYPPIAEQMGLEGRVVLLVFVDKEGLPAKVTARKSSDKSFEEAARDAMDRFRFKPARYKGRPIGLYMAFPFRFTFLQRRGIVEHFDYGFGLR